MLAEHRYVDQEMSPRCTNGVDHGIEAKVLIRAAGARLLWRPGHKYWGGVGRPQSYAPAGLEIAKDDTDCWGMNKRLGNFEERGVRLHEALRRHRAEIDAVFGPGSTALVDVKRTLVLGEGA